MPGPRPMGKGRSRSAWSRGLGIAGALLAAAELLAGALFAATPVQSPPQLGEGPLRNDTFVPVHAEAEALLLEGDEQLAAARVAGRGIPPTALDAWREAIQISAATDAVALIPAGNPADWPDPSGMLARRHCAPTLAVHLRLTTLGDEGYGAWLERFAPLAADSLAALPYDPRALARLERVYPGTPAAAIAALRLSDSAREQGRLDRASSYLERARRHGSILAAAAERWALPEDWARHLEHRAASLAQPSSSGLPAMLQPGANKPAAKGDAPTWSLVRAMRLESRAGELVPGRQPPLGLGIQPHGATSPRGDLLIQTPRAIIWLDAAALSAPVGGGQRLLPFSDWLDLPPERPYVPPAAGGWPLMPLRAGNDLVLVIGRGSPARTRRDLPVPARGNHLVMASLSETGDLEVRWTLAGPGLDRPGIPSELAGNQLGPGTWEFQPGPVRAAGALVVLARGLADHAQESAGSGPVSAGLLRLVGLDWATGKLLWSTDLARASDLVDSTGEAVGMGSQTQRISMPLAARGSSVIVGTHAGVLACVDASDGRLEWSLRNQRRRAGERSWPGSDRPLLSGEHAWLTPGDSEYLYALPAGPATQPLFAVPPAPRAERLLLAAAWGDGGLLALARSGRQRALQLSSGGAPQDLLYLGAEERFSGTSAVRGDQVLIATSRSFLGISSEDWSLEASVPLPDLGAGVGGNVLPLAAGAAVVGADTVWVLGAR